MPQFITVTLDGNLERIRLNVASISRYWRGDADNATHVVLTDGTHLGSRKVRRS